eukprot:Rhum_TRINITY_DN8510_c0_g1::Rhum_TRINITY_DN8510_c0_g1_i1::g.28451::m.28451
MGGLCCKCRRKRRGSAAGGSQGANDAAAHAAAIEQRSRSESTAGASATTHATGGGTGTSPVKAYLDAVLFGEDTKRAVMLDVAESERSKLGAPRSGRIRRGPHGGLQYARIGYRVASAAVTHCLVCNGCETRLCSVSEARLNTDKSRCKVAMDDSSISVRVPFPIEGPLYEQHAEDKSPQALCKGDMEAILKAPVAGRVWSSDNNSDELHQRNVVCRGCRCFLGLVVGQATYLCLRYVRVVDAVSDQPLFGRAPLSCTDCSRVLSYADQLLCTKRRWSFGSSTVSQSACYVNSVVESSVDVRNPQDMHLAQGRFVMADVFCTCGKQVGYKFCKDLTRDGRNVYQIGRYGLVSSCFKLGAQPAAEMP